MKYTLFCVALAFASQAKGQVTDTTIRHPDKPPAAPKVWRVAELKFQEDYAGGTGTFQVPGAGFSTSLEFREVSIRPVVRDSAHWLLLKFKTGTDWNDTLSVFRCNATKSPGVVGFASRASVTYEGLHGDKSPGWAWEVYIYGWNLAFTNRVRPFSFFVNFKRR